MLETTGGTMEHSHWQPLDRFRFTAFKKVNFSSFVKICHFLKLHDLVHHHPSKLDMLSLSMFLAKSI